MAQRAAWVITGSAADAADAAQEGFVRAWLALPRFRPGSEFRPWLLKIVGNCARNRRRSEGRAERLAVRAAAGDRDESGQSPEAAALSAERRDLLMAALQQVSERDRQVLACRFLLDLSEAETAAVLSCARGTVKSRTSRALLHLRAVVDADAASLEESTR